MMANYITAIRTSTGDTKIDYNGLANLPDVALNGHTHNASEITSGVLPVEKGGTGVNNLNSLASTIGAMTLSDVGNLHVWERVQTYAEPVPEVPAGYTLGEVETDVTAVSVNTTSPGATIKSVLVYYANEPTVYSNGNLSIDTGNQVYINSTNYNEMAKLKGKFISVGDIGQQVNETDLIKGVIYYIPSDSIITYSNDNPCWVKFSKIQRVTGYPYTPAIPAGTTTDYLTSTDRNAYTDGTVDNTTITYLGQLGGGARIETGSYVGTGTYGSSNPNSLTFGFEPKVVIVQDYEGGFGYPTSVWLYGCKKGFVSTNAVVQAWNGRNLEWYGTSNANIQLNASGYKYNYIALG